MDGTNIKYNKIVFVFEFLTPNGYLPFGYTKDTISLNFIEHLNINTHNRNGVFLSNYTTPYKFNLEHPIFVEDLTSRSKNLSISLISDLQELDENTLYLIPFESTNVCPLFEQYGYDYIDFENYFTPKTLDYIVNNENFGLLFMDNREGAYNHETLMIENIKRFLDKFNITTQNKVIVSTNNNKILDLRDYDGRINYYNNKYYIYLSGQFISELLQQNKQQGNDGYIHSLNIDFDYSKKEKLFLMYNRNTSRMHRPLFVNELYKNNLLDSGLVSLFDNFEFENMISNSNQIDELDIDETKFKELSENYKNFYPRYIDNSDAELVANLHNYLSRKDEYEQTYFTIVGETNAQKDYCFITEKTMKPIMNLHPFFIVGNPFSLKFLKEVGFRTFEDWWDESYDTEINFVKRVDMIIDEIKKLSNLSKDELNNMFQSMEEVLIYNKKLLHSFSRKNYLQKELFKIANYTKEII